MIPGATSGKSRRIAVPSLDVVRRCKRGLHLRRIVAMYASYYNEARTHLSLAQDAPISRRHPPIDRPGARAFLRELDAVARVILSQAHGRAKHVEARLRENAPNFWHI